MDGQRPRNEAAAGARGDEPTPVFDAPDTSPEINIESVEQVNDDPSRLLAAPTARGELGRLGQYRVLALLGQGGMGAVFRALDTRLQREVALKVMKPSIADMPEARERFLREARALAALTSQHVVSIFDVSRENEPVFLAMELLAGISLQDWLDAGGNPTVAEILRLAREISLGLNAAHERGLVHRDVKPANLWLQAPIGRVKLLDFGLVRPGEDPRLTQTGLILGTPQYMSPEQAAGEPLDPRSDLFSLGCVLYRLCTGKPAFSGSTTLAVLARLSTHHPTPVQELNRDAPAGLADLIMEMLAKRPAARPASAREVIRRVRALERAGADSKSDHPPRRSRSKLKHTRKRRASGLLTRHPWIWLVAGEVLIALAVLTGLILHRASDRAEPREEKSEQPRAQPVRTP